MGQAIGQSPSSKVLFMDPQSIPGAIQSLLTMSDQKTTEALTIQPQPFGASTNIPPALRNFPEIVKPFKPPSDKEKTDPTNN